MEFKKYSSIENTYREQFLDLVREEGKDKGDWVVMEKIHGAQFSLYCDGKEVRASSRGNFLEGGMDFYNWEKILEDNRDRVIRLYEMLKAENPEIAQVVVYGELFGGSYPHPDVPKVKTARRLQKGVYYHPDNLFYAFDIRVDGRYLNMDRCCALFEEVGLFYARPIFRGTFRECLEHPNRFPSKIAGWLGLPPIEDNISEGIVIKPVEPDFLDIGERLILKSKNETFEERKAIKKRPKKQPRRDTPLSENARKLSGEMEALVTENRLQNVLSKREEMPYPVPQDYFGTIMKEFTADILEEFNKDFENDFDNLEKVEQKTISKALNQWAARLVKKVLFSKK